MTDKNANADAPPEDSQERRTGRQVTRISGDPGVGGLLANPEEAVAKPKRPPKTDLGPPTPDPELPQAHGDWAPNRAWRGRANDRAKSGGKITGN